MRVKSKIPFLILMGTALICSRLMFALFDDPEGPNLLVVTVAAALIYLMSLGAYSSALYPSLTGSGRVAATVLAQLLIATAFYLLQR